MLFTKGLSRGLLNQYCAGTAACMVMLCSATLYAWMTPLLSYLLEPDSEIPMTPTEVSWLVPIISLSGVLSSIPSAKLSNRMGRKPILLALGPGYIISWAMILYFPSVLMLGAARFLQGLVMGAAFTVVPIYLGEVASKTSRGAITSLFFNAYWLGLLLAYAVGSYLSYRQFTYFSMALNVPFLLLFVWQPESPYYYVMIGNEERALETLAWFSTSPTEKLKEELKEIQLSLEAKASSVSLLTNPVDRKALVLLCAMSSLKPFSGVSPLEVYATSVFELTPNSLISPDMVTVCFGVVLLVGSCIGACTADTFGRRPLLMVTCVGAMVCQFLAGTYYFLLLNTSVQVSSFSWVAVVLVLTASGLCTAGIFPVCSSYTSELFTSSTRSVASSLAIIVNFFVNFVGLIIYQLLIDYCGMFMNFYFFSLSLALGALYLYKSAPETKGKSFAQIRLELCAKTCVQPTLTV